MVYHIGIRLGDTVRGLYKIRIFIKILIMINPPKQGYLMPPIKCLFTGKLIYPTEWFKIIKDHAFSPEETKDAIFYYKFIITCLIKSISFIIDNKELKNKVNEIFNSSYTIFAKKNFKIFIFYESLIRIITFFSVSHKYYDFGISDTKKTTNEFYNYWNEYYALIFGDNYKKNNDINKYVKNKIIQSDQPNKNELFNQAKCISIPNINNLKILNLLNFLERIENKYSKMKSEENNISKELITQENNNRIEQTIQEINFVLSYFNDGLKQIATNIIEMKYDIKVLNDNISSNNSYIENIIIKNSEILQKIISDEGISISNKIITYINDNTKKQYNCAQKIIMIALYPEFDICLQVLINKGYVTERNTYFEWKYDNNLKNAYFNILAHFIFNNTNIKDKMTPLRNKKQKKLNSDTDEARLQRKKAFEPFSIGFKRDSLHEDLKDFIPSKYNEFITQINKDSNVEIIFK